ncbi:MAG: DNA mismatch repair protein MutS [Pyrinomonadaceae bacterium]|nr:DNA mismatch repair protein MutS [Pyrinomonadaceae bacterium]
MQSLTPMLRQYAEIKKKFPGMLLFFRLGDFYELFGEDAVIGSRELNITLTSRMKDSLNPVPMCGVPHHSVSSYLSKLVKRGYKVAICEQVEQPSKNKKIVRREVVRVITPGTAFDYAEAHENLWLASVCASGDRVGLSFLDLSTGDFLAAEFVGGDSWQKASSEVESFSPKELLFPESIEPVVRSLFSGERFSFIRAFTPLNDFDFDYGDCASLLKSHFKVFDLRPFELEDKVEAVRSSGAVLRYVQQTQRTLAEHVCEVRYFADRDFMILDPVTLRNLEVVESLGQNVRRSLFHVVNETVTGMGSRLLRSWLLRPCLSVSEIKNRLDAVEELTDSLIRSELRNSLSKISDLERLVGKLNLGTITPRELRSLALSLREIPNLVKTLSDAQSPLISYLVKSIFPMEHIQKLIFDAIVENPPSSLSEGNVIRQGFNEELDELRKISINAKQIIASFEDEERKRTGINSLKVKFNNVFGYFIEVSKANLSRVPSDYERKQTLVNAERFTTRKLKEWEEKVLSAEERIKELEAAIFSEVRNIVQKETKKLQITARSIATIDSLQALAEVAMRRNYSKPLIHESDELQIIGGRHPVVEAFLQDPFVPNSIYMNNSTDRLLIITGPNMGGKSTLLRQVALIQILAQIGSFVPASSAKLPVVDRIWTRVGASDDITSGRSTFMVEMTETATILHNATPKSLVLLDEIGRGTSTFDGLSIAWAIAEYLHNSTEHSAKTLFATHYHELTELADLLPGAKNYRISAIEKDGNVVFLHKLEKGKASKSYGIAVAQLAGLPQKVIQRAREVLERLERYELAVFANEKGLKKAASKRVVQQATLFSLINDKIIEEIRSTDFDSLSDVELRQFVKKIKEKIV